MLDNKFDKILKEGLENSRVDWDKDAFWDQMEPSIPKKKFYRRPLFFILMATLLCLTLAYFIVPFNTQLNSNNTTASTNNTIESQASSSKNIQIQKEITPDISNLNQINKDQKESITSNKNSKNPNQTSSSSGDEIARPNQKNAKKKEDKRSFVQDKKTPPFQLNSTENIQKFSEDISRDAVLFAENHGKITKEVVDRSDYQLSTHDYKVIELASSNNIVDDFTAKLQLSTIFNLSLPSKVSSLDLSNALELMDQANFAQTKIKPISKLSTTKAFQWSMYGVAGMSQKNNNSILPEDGQYGTDSETMLENIGLGFQAIKYLNSSLYLKAGVEYNRAISKLDYQIEGENFVPTIVDTAFYHYDMNGNLQYLSAKRNVKETVSNQVVHYNSYSAISSPISIGYGKQFNKMNISAYAGVNILWNGRFTGRYVDNDYNVSEEITNKINFGLQGIHMGISNQWPVFKNTHMYTALEYQKGIRSLEWKPDLAEKLDYYQVKIGICHGLN